MNLYHQNHFEIDPDEETLEGMAILLDWSPEKRLKVFGQFCACCGLRLGGRVDGTPKPGHCDCQYPLFIIPPDLSHEDDIAEYEINEKWLGPGQPMNRSILTAHFKHTNEDGQPCGWGYHGPIQDAAVLVIRYLEGRIADLKARLWEAGE